MIAVSLPNDSDTTVNMNELVIFLQQLKTIVPFFAEQNIKLTCDLLCQDSACSDYASNNLTIIPISEKRARRLVTCF